MGQGDTLLNALIGAVVSVLLAFLPFSPLIGGGVAGYLQRGTRNDGLRVGGISGLITMIPLFLVASLLGGVFFLQMVGLDPRAGFGFGFLVLFALLFFVLYTVALSALGGYLGAYVVSETDIRV